MSNPNTPTKPREQMSLKQLLSQDNMKAQFAAALPKHLKVDRFCRVAITALSRTPKLTQCTQESFFKCLLDLSALGLEPDGRRAHLIPYNNRKANTVECTLIIDWKGLAELAMNSGIIAKLHADIICENDEFEYNLGEVTKHVVNWKKPRGAMYAAYAMAVTKDGATFVQVMTKDEIEGIRARSKSKDDGPWKTDYNEMAKKTVFRRLSKWLPLSAEFRDATEKDEEDIVYERDVSPAATAAPSRPTAPVPELLREPPLQQPVPVANEQPEFLEVEEAWGEQEPNTDKTETAHAPEPEPTKDEQRQPEPEPKPETPPPAAKKEAAKKKAGWKDCVVHFGKATQGKTLGSLDVSVLRWFADTWLPTARAAEELTNEDKALIAALDEMVNEMK